MKNEKMDKGILFGVIACLLPLAAVPVIAIIKVVL